MMCAWLNSTKMKRKMIPSAGPSITEKEIELVTEAVRHGWYENRNMHLDKFVSEFRDYLGMKHVLPTANCTSAIHLAMISLGIKPGDEVIVPDITWVSSASPVTYVGAKPVFVDIDKDDWCISPKAFEKAITKKTKAAVVVNLLGNMPKMDELMEIAGKHQIPIIEDNAEAIGAEYKSKKAGTFGDISVFSFNATKLMIAGQGGVLATNNKDYFDTAKLFQHHGIDQEKEGKYYWSYEIGYNYQWTNMQAALALAQLRRLDEIVKKKRQIGKLYMEKLADVGGLFLNHEASNVKNTFWIVTAIVSQKYGLKKEEIMERAKKYSIDIRPFFYPISSMPAYQPYCKGKDMAKINPVAYEISPYGICLPSAMILEEPDVDYVCDSLKKILNRDAS